MTDALPNLLQLVHFEEFSRRVLLQKLRFLSRFWLASRLLSIEQQNGMSQNVGMGQETRRGKK